MQLTGLITSTQTVYTYTNYNPGSNLTRTFLLSFCGLLSMINADRSLFRWYVTRSEKRNLSVQKLFSGLWFFESKKNFLYLRSKKKFLWIKESFVNSKKCSLIQRNKFVYVKENFFESTKLSSIQRNFFFDRISIDSKKLFSGRSFHKRETTIFKPIKIPHEQNDIELSNSVDFWSFFYSKKFSLT